MWLGSRDKARKKFQQNHPIFSLLHWDHSFQMSTFHLGELTPIHSKQLHPWLEVAHGVVTKIISVTSGLQLRKKSHIVTYEMFIYL
jgi:hypothetical protein